MSVFAVGRDDHQAGKHAANGHHSLCRSERAHGERFQVGAHVVE
jgi:hypothetical protein